MLPLIDVKKPAYKVKIINGVINGVSPEWHEIKHFWCSVFGEEWAGRCCGVW